jgi:hypothetical protein
MKLMTFHAVLHIVIPSLVPIAIFLFFSCTHVEISPLAAHKNVLLKIVTFEDQKSVQKVFQLRSEAFVRDYNPVPTYLGVKQYRDAIQSSRSCMCVNAQLIVDEAHKHVHVYQHQKYNVCGNMYHLIQEQKLVITILE